MFLRLSTSISSMASTNIILLLFIVFLLFSRAQTWIKAGYWFSGSNFPISDINSPLFTHLICAFAYINPTTYHLSISPSDQTPFSSFTTTVKQNNPSIKTLLSIGGGLSNYSTYYSMVTQPSYRRTFIETTIQTARVHGFDGLDFSWVSAESDSDMTNMATLFDEWRVAIETESRNSTQSKLILTSAVHYSPYLGSASFRVDSVQRNLDWVHVLAYDYYTPNSSNQTGAHAALYDPSSEVNTDYGISAWINGGLMEDKIVLALPFYGYAWRLVNPGEGGVGAEADGVASSSNNREGSMTYTEIKGYMQRNGVVALYNATYVVKYCSVGSSWIGFDDAEVVKIKVSYAKGRNLSGYVVWQVPYDDNWELSQAAAQEDEVHHRNNRQLLLIILLPTIAIFLLLGCAMWCLRRRLIIFKDNKILDLKQGAIMADVVTTNDSNLKVFTFAEMIAATNNFSSQNKLGEGGYGPVYKGILHEGQEIAVKRLSKTSTQGFEEFKTEVIFTAKLEHVNLVRVLGFCTERKENLLVYEYMPNKSLDFYIYDPIRRFLLDWKKRVHIIEGVTQGLLYLQEYSRLTIIHRDLKGSNILLDNEMKPKISDFGMARSFPKHEFEANTSKVVGTYGYIPPEYVKRGIYSTKSDVYSFGVLLLQTISGKPNTCLHGVHEDLNLLQYAYELLKEGKGMEFMDPSLEDTSSTCKLMICMHIALLCVQENSVDRPTMLDVSSMLKNENSSMAFPKKPAYYCTKNGENENIGENESTLRQETWSVDKATITQTVAR